VLDVDPAVLKIGKNVRVNARADATEFAASIKARGVLEVITTYRDEDGEVRLTTPAMDWPAYVNLAFEEIRLVGAASPQVSRRLQAALEDLKTVAPPERRPVLDHQLELLAWSTNDLVGNPRDVEMGLSPDRLGLGVRADMVSFAAEDGDKVQGSSKR